MSIASSEAGRSYTQCTLRWGTKTQVAWIPTDFAVLDNRINVREDNREIKQWIVDAVHEETTYGDLNKQRLAEKRWREVLK